MVTKGKISGKTYPENKSSKPYTINQPYTHNQCSSSPKHCECTNRRPDSCCCCMYCHKA
jgi:hypothetical protein